MAEQTTAELTEEVQRLRQQIAELEAELARHEQTEAALRESEDRYESIIALTTDYFFRVAYTPDGRFEMKWIAEDFVRLTGLDVAEVKDPAMWQQVIHADDWPGVEKSLEIILSGKAVEVQFRLRAKGGETLWLIVFARPERDAETGRVSGFLAAAKDFTDRKRTEEALRESEERFDLAVRGTDAGIWDWDLRTDTVYFSPRWKSMLGYAEDEIAGTFSEWERRLHPDDRERAFAVIEDYLNGRTSDYELEHRLRHKDGSYRWILARGVAVRDRQGNPYRMVGSHLDITERKQAEQTIRERDAELAHVTRLATMGEMVAEIAHEVNQPLYAIGNFASACRHLLDHVDGKLSQRLAEGLGEIDKAAERAGGIIQRVREYVSRTTQERQRVQIGEIVRTSLELLGSELESREVRVTVEEPASEGTLEVMVDCVQIEQVLINLLRNACEAMNEMPAEDLRIIVKLIPSADSVEIAVEDNGVGISEEVSSKMFDTFFTTKKNGLGMGLAISKRIVSEYGGRLWATSDPGRGATFHFTLPLAGDADPESPQRGTGPIHVEDSAK